MKNKILPFTKKYIWLITPIITLGGVLVASVQLRTEIQSPILNYYTAEITPEISDNDLQKARRALEDSLFQSVNDLVSIDTSLTYSEALDKVLPLSETVDDLAAGVVIVIRNQGKVTAHDIHANISLEVPIENYEIFSNEPFAVVDENKPEGRISINVDRLTSDDEVQIAILYPGAYTVSLTVSRVGHPTSPVKQVATQKAIGSDIQNISSSNDFLQFYIESLLDSIEATVFVSSAELQGENFSTPRDIHEERDLFLEAFQQ